MLRKIHNYINEYNMLEKGDRIVLGVSGGADSVCLFYVLKHFQSLYDLSLFVVHVNHGIRGQEADEDEAYVEYLCRKYGIAYEVVQANVKRRSKEEGISEEEAGRLSRYDAFYQCAKKNNCNKIAVAHNKNDNAETILFHMFRGSGLQGLSGIRPVRENIIRPLLYTERKEIEGYLKEENIKYCIDSTNGTDDYSRNKIRHHVLGYAVEHINSNAISHLVQASEHIYDTRAYVEKKTEEAFERLVEYSSQSSYKINIIDLQTEDIIIQRGIVRKILNLLSKSLKDIQFIHVESILELQEKQVGKEIHLPGGVVSRREYSHIVTELTKKESMDEKNSVRPIEIELSFEKESQIFIEAKGYSQTLNIKLIKWEKNMIIPQNGYTKWFDYDKIKNTVFIRTRADGDYIHINNEGKKKKLKSLFIDQKIPKEERQNQLLVADGSHIMWILGNRNSEGYRINQETKVILEISLNGGKEDGAKD